MNNLIGHELKTLADKLAGSEFSPTEGLYLPMPSFILEAKPVATRRGGICHLQLRLLPTGIPVDVPAAILEGAKEACQQALQDANPGVRETAEQHLASFQQPRMEKDALAGISFQLTQRVKEGKPITRKAVTDKAGRAIFHYLLADAPCQLRAERAKTLQEVLRDIRLQWFEAGEKSSQQGEFAAIEITSRSEGKSECLLTIGVTPYEPPAGDLTAVEIELSVEDENGEWSERGKQRLAANGTHFGKVRRGANCWIELLPVMPPCSKTLTQSSIGKSARTILEKVEAPETLKRSKEAPVLPPPGKPAPSMPEPVSAADLLRSSSSYREFQAEREQILMRKWIESEKAGRDIGFERALTDWIIRGRSKWRKTRQALLPGSPQGTQPEKPKKLKPLKHFAFEDSTIDVEVAISEEGHLWLTIHTSRPESAGAAAMFQFGPVLGTVGCKPRARDAGAFADSTCRRTNWKGSNRGSQSNRSERPNFPTSRGICYGGRYPPLGRNSTARAEIRITSCFGSELLSRL